MLNVTQTNSAEYSKRVFLWRISSANRSSVTHRHRPRISAPSRESLDTVNKSTESSKYLALLLQLNFTVNFREQNQVFYSIVESGRIAVEEGRSSVNRGVSLTVTGQSRVRTETERTSEWSYAASDTGCVSNPSSLTNSLAAYNKARG